MTVIHDAAGVRLIHGDVSDPATIAGIPARSVQTIVTSPPYFGLRDYGEDAQIGAEESLLVYVEKLVSVFHSLRRTLSDDGTLWLNLGDSYARNPAKGFTGTMNGRNVPRMGYNGGNMASPDVPEKNLLGVPWRVALALQDDGWILRSDIIWAKPNPMPESVEDRPTKSHEHLFLFAKSPRYYYDAEAIREPASMGAAGSRFDTGKTARHQLDRAQKRPPKQGYAADGEHRDNTDAETRNKRDVWTIPTVPFAESHFAVYPPELVRPCVRAGSRVGDTVLDPFSGSGTTGMVARQEGRKYIGIDLNRDYLDLSLRTRFAQPVMDVWGGDAA